MANKISSTKRIAHDEKALDCIKLIMKRGDCASCVIPYLFEEESYEFENEMSEKEADKVVRLFRSKKALDSRIKKAETRKREFDLTISNQNSGRMRIMIADKHSGYLVASLYIEKSKPETVDLIADFIVYYMYYTE